MVSKILAGLIMFNSTNLALNSDVESRHKDVWFHNLFDESSTSTY